MGLLDFVPVAIIGATADGHVSEMNSAAVALLGLQNLDDARTTNLFLEGLVIEDDRPKIRERLAEALSGAATPTAIRVSLRARGGRRQVSLRMGPTRDKTGRIDGVAIAAQDDDSRQASAGGAVLHAISDLLDEANAVILSLDNGGFVTECNRRACGLAGLPHEQVLGKKLSELSASPKELSDRMASTLAGWTSQPFDLQWDADTSLVVGLSPQRGSDNKVVGALFVAHVVKAQLQQQTLPDSDGESAALKVENHRKSKGMAMHELRSPLHGIIGLADTLSQDVTRYQKPLKVISSSASRVLELVTNLMDFWNLVEDPSGDSCDDLVDMVMLTKETMDRCEHTVDKNGKNMRKAKVEFKAEVPEDISRLRGDPQNLRQMLYHLFMNALKFTKEGTVTVTLKEAQGITISVADTGIGIGQESQARVFEAFQQEDITESRRYEGIGLGLTIAMAVAKQHGGYITCLSVADKGSTFTVFFPPPVDCSPLTLDESGIGRPALEPLRVPIAAAAPPEQASNTYPDPLLWLCRPASAPVGYIVVSPSFATVEKLPFFADSGPSKRQVSQVSEKLPFMADPGPSRRHVSESQHGITIVSVDDDHVNQEVMRSSLEPCGYKVVVCMSGAECLQYMEQQGADLPELVLLDLMMPGLNGFDVLQATRKKYGMEHIPIIMVSAKNQTSSVVKGFDFGCNDWIHKPFQREELLARVRHQINMRKAAIRRQTQLPMAPCALPPPSPPVVMTTCVIESTALFVSMSAMSESDALDDLAVLFEQFEALSEKHNMTSTEAVGTCYLAVAHSSAENETRHADSVLMLALDIEAAVRGFVNERRSVASSLRFRMGVHSDSHRPVAIRAKVSRQYPKTCFYGGTVAIAKQLSERCTRSRALISLSTRCRLKPDIETLMLERGFTVVSQEGERPERFNIYQGCAQQLDAGGAGGACGSGGGGGGSSSDEGMGSQAKLRAAQGQLASTRAQLDAVLLQMEHLLAEKRRAEQNGSMGMGTSAPPGGMAPHGGTGALQDGGAAILLQWQIAHLTAELRHKEQALATTRADLQIQVASVQTAERRFAKLSERMEHMELDLHFRPSMPSWSGLGYGGGGLGGGKPPPMAPPYGMPTACMPPGGMSMPMPDCFAGARGYDDVPYAPYSSQVGADGGQPTGSNGSHAPKRYA